MILLAIIIGLASSIGADEIGSVPADFGNIGWENRLYLVEIEEA